MIHVCFSLYDKNGRYSKFTGTAMLSIFENTTSPVTVHILHDNTLTTDNRDKFIYLAVRYGQAVKFYNVEELCADKIEEFKRLLPFAKDSTRTVAMFFRFLITELLSENKKVIYLDSDIVVNLDINELWRVELGDKILAVVPEMKSYVPTNPLHYLCRENFVRAEDFFNSGVLVMNLERFRHEEETLKRGIKFRTQHTECDGNDQAILNYCFSTQTVKLPLKFNVLVEFARMNNDFETLNRICHYITSAHGRGFGLDAGDAYNRLWLNYFIKTPWFNLEAIGRLYKNFQETYLQLHSDENKSMIKLSAAMSGKTRAFITVESELRKLVEIFSVRNDEEIIIVADSIHVNKIIEKIYSSRDEKIFFILLPNFPFTVLTKAGLVQGRDFFNAYDFFPENLRKPQISYALLQSM